MQELYKYRLELAVIGFLIFLKFLYIPIEEWQSDIQDKTEFEQIKLAKAERALRNSTNISDAQVKLNDYVKSAEGMLFDVDNESAFELQMQQAFEKDVADKKLKLLNFGWKSSKISNRRLVKEKVAEIQVEGSLNNIIKLMTTLESNTKLHRISGLTSSIKRRGKNKFGRVTMRFSLHYFLKVNQNGA